MATTTNKPMTVAERLVAEIRSDANYNPNVQVAPPCILWPDGDRQFEPIIPRLLQEMPELYVLGDYLPEQRTGPAIWLRLVIADKIDELRIPAGQTPIIYLPGIRRQDLPTTGWTVTTQIPNPKQLGNLPAASGSSHCQRFFCVS